MKQNITRGYVSLNFNDSENVPYVQVSFSGKTINAEYLSPYGIYSNPPKQSNAFIFSVGCDNGNLGALCSDHKTRIKNLKQGEVAIANTQTGTLIKLDAEGNVTINAPNNKIVTVKGDINLTAEGSVTIIGSKVTTQGNTDLNGGGAGVARIGDAITITEINGSPASGTGVISEGSSTVKAAS